MLLALNSLKDSEQSPACRRKARPADAAASALDRRSVSAAWTSAGREER